MTKKRKKWIVLIVLEICMVLALIVTICKLETTPAQLQEVIPEENAPMQILEVIPEETETAQFPEVIPEETAFTQEEKTPVQVALGEMSNEAALMKPPLKEHNGKNEEEEIYNLQDNLYDWLKANDTEEQKLSLWKKNDKDGNLLLSLRDQEGETVVTFIYERGSDEWSKRDEDYKFEWVSNNIEEWTHCSEYYSTFTLQDLIDVAFTAYREVSGNWLADVQYQSMVLFNRDKSPSFDDTIRGVILQDKPNLQYSCRRHVEKRKLKNGTMFLEDQQYTPENAEEHDLEKCFRVALLTFAEELIEDVPRNVVYAAPFKQGSGVWKFHNGTYYCYE